MKQISGRFLVVSLALAAGLVRAASVMESARELPVAQEVDVVVVGGSCGAVAAAQSAGRMGMRVYLVTSYDALGEDLAGFAVDDGEVDQRAGLDRSGGYGGESGGDLGVGDFGFEISRDVAVAVQELFDFEVAAVVHQAMGA